MALPEELYDVFYVTQITRGTLLGNIVAVDWVRVDPWKRSQKHRHSEAETVLFINQGSGYVMINDEQNIVKAGDRLSISRGAWHSVLAFQDGLVFISIQSPSIHDEATGRHDLELFPEQGNKDLQGMEYLLSLFLNSETFAAWQKRYRMKYTVTQKEIMVEIEPFPPDTFDSIYDDMVGRELERLEGELADKGISACIDYERCALFESIFRLYVCLAT